MLITESKKRQALMNLLACLHLVGITVEEIRIPLPMTLTLSLQHELQCLFTVILRFLVPNPSFFFSYSFSDSIFFYLSLLLNLFFMYLFVFIFFLVFCLYFSAFFSSLLIYTTPLFLSPPPPPRTCVKV